MSEKNIQDDIRVALSDLGFLTWRNNIGVCEYEKGSRVKYGVANPGGSDLIGIGPGGKFLAIECKSKTGRLTEDQENFIRVVNERGGIAGVAKSVEEAIALVINHETLIRTAGT